MATNFSVAFVNQYKANIELLMQQKGSKLEEAVRIEPQTGEYGYYDQLDAYDVDSLTAVSSSNAATVISDMNIKRRRVGLEYFPFATMIDKPDQVRMLVNPNSAIAESIAYLFGRKKDKIILTAASGIAYTGKQGGTSTTFDSDMTVTASGNAWSGSTVGLNVDKLRGASYLLNSQDVPMEDRIIVAHPYQQADLLNTTAVTSTDYNSVKALVGGEVDSFMGFRFIWTTLVDKVGDDYICYAWHKTAMLLAIGQDDFGFNARIEEDMTHNYATQVYNEMMVGATRMDEARIVQIKCQ